MSYLVEYSIHRIYAQHSQKYDNLGRLAKGIIGVVCIVTAKEVNADEKGG